MRTMKFDVFDLDGTIFPGNTFHQFSWFIIRQACLRADVPRAFGALKLTALRGFRRITHFEWKARLLRIAEGVPSADLAGFARQIATQSRPRLEQLLNGEGGRHPRILATAAPELYAKLLGPLLGFDNVISSKLERGALVEANKSIKRDLVLAYSAKSEMNIGRLFTDHHDDLPLAAVSERCFLVNPSSATVAAFERCRVPFAVVRV